MDDLSLRSSSARRAELKMGLIDVMGEDRKVTRVAARIELESLLVELLDIGRHRPFLNVAMFL